MTVRRSGMSYALLYVPNPLSGRRVDYQLLTSIHRTLGALSRDWRTSMIRSAATALEPSPRSAAQHRREPRPDDGALPVLVDGCAGARLERTAPAEEAQGIAAGSRRVDFDSIMLTFRWGTEQAGGPTKLRTRR
jgi:hypothetical protein